jgi:hypothetical protein
MAFKDFEREEKLSRTCLVGLGHEPTGRLDRGLSVVPRQLGQSDHRFAERLVRVAAEGPGDA